MAYVKARMTELQITDKIAGMGQTFQIQRQEESEASQDIFFGSFWDQKLLMNHTFPQFVNFCF